MRSQRSVRDLHPQELDLATQLGMNTGVSFQDLVQGTADSLPVAPPDLRMEQLEIPPSGLAVTAQFCVPFASSATVGIFRYITSTSVIFT
jgi:hypothetical protein